MLPFRCVILYTNAMQQPFLPNNTSLSSSPLNLEQRLDVLQLPEAKLLIGEDIKASPESQGADEAANQRAEYQRTVCSLNVMNYLYYGGDENYHKLTAAQNDANRLTREEFEEFHQWVASNLSGEHSANVMRYIMLIHDLGKNQTLASAVMGEDAADSVDHDEVLRRLLRSDYAAKRTELLPTFSQLSKADQTIIRDVMSTELNLGQFIQAEAPPATLASFAESTEPVRSLYIMHTLFDIAGALGHVNAESSLLLTSPLYNQMAAACDVLTDSTLPTDDARYAHYLARRAQRFGLDNDAIEQLIDNQAHTHTVRLACMLRYDTPEEYQQLTNALDTLPGPVQAILAQELSNDGIHQRATLPYYGPALLKGLEKHHSLSAALTYFAHVLQEAHIADKAARKAGETGVVTADLSTIAQAANQGTLDPHHAELRFHRSGETLVPEYQDTPELAIDSLPAFDSEQLHGKRIIYLGMGGGSDGIQAAMLSKLHQQHHAVQPTAIVSVRNFAADSNKQLAHTGRQIGDALAEITKETTKVGDWRFLEDIIAKDETIAPVYLLNSIEPEQIAHDLQLLIRETGADAICGIDTGGDVLYHANTAIDPTTSSPDQDYAVLAALHMVNAAAEADGTPLNVFTAIVAPGVDTPPYANDMLASSNAQRYILQPDDTTTITQTYAAWRMDGSASEEGLYGKTPLAWIAALTGKHGLQPLALPRANATSAYNPWRIFMNIRPSTARVVMMQAEQLYQAVNH